MRAGRGLSRARTARSGSPHDLSRGHQRRAIRPKSGDRDVALGQIRGDQLQGPLARIAEAASTRRLHDNGILGIPQLHQRRFGVMIPDRTVLDGAAGPREAGLAALRPTQQPHHRRAHPVRQHVDQGRQNVMCGLAQDETLAEPPAVHPRAAGVRDELLALHQQRRALLEHLHRDVPRRGRVHQRGVTVAMAATALAAGEHNVVVEDAPPAIAAVSHAGGRQTRKRLHTVGQHQGKRAEHRGSAEPPDHCALVHRGGVAGIEDAALRRADVQRPEAARIAGDVRSQDRLKRIHGVGRRIRVGAVHAADRQLVGHVLPVHGQLVARHGDRTAQAQRPAGRLELGVAVVRAVGYRRDRLAHRRLGPRLHLVGERLERVQAVLAHEGKQPLRAHAVRADLGLDVAEDHLRITDVAADQRGQLPVQLAPAVQFEGRDLDPLVVDLAGAPGILRAAHVGAVGD